MKFDYTECWVGYDNTVLHDQCIAGGEKNGALQQQHCCQKTEVLPTVTGDQQWAVIVRATETNCFALMSDRLLSKNLWDLLEMGMLSPDMGKKLDLVTTGTVFTPSLHFSFLSSLLHKNQPTNNKQANKCNKQHETVSFLFAICLPSLISSVKKKQASKDTCNDFYSNNHSYSYEKRNCPIGIIDRVCRRNSSCSVLCCFCSLIFVVGWVWIWTTIYTQRTLMEDRRQ